MESESSKKLKKTMRELWLKVRGSNRTRASGEPVVDTSPGCAFGALLEERLKGMEGNIQELIFLLIGVVLIEVIMRLVG